MSGVAIVWGSERGERDFLAAQELADVDWAIAHEPMIGSINLQLLVGIELLKP